MGHIKNKLVRSMKYQELKRKDERRKKAERKKRQEAVKKAIDAGKEPPQIQQPQVPACVLVLGWGS